MLIFVLILTYFGGNLALASMQDQTGTLPFSLGIVYLIFPISGAIMLLGLLVELIKIYQSKDSKVSKLNEDGSTGESG